MADVIELNSEEVLDIDGAGNGSQVEKSDKKKTPKSHKKRSIFRKSKFTASEELSESEDTPPAIKLSRKRFGFVKKDRNPTIKNEPERAESSVEVAGPDDTENAAEASQMVTEKASGIEVSIADSVYAGPENEEEPIKDEKENIQGGSKIEEASEVKQDDEEQTIAINNTKESGQKRTVSKIPVKKARKQYWKRISKDRSVETPNSRADAKESEEAIEYSTTEVDEVTIEEGDEKKPSKTRRILKWKRETPETKSAEEDAHDTNKDEHQAETTEEVIVQESGNAEIATEKKENKPRRLLKWKRSSKIIESVDSAAQTSIDESNHVEDSFTADSNGAKTTGESHQETKDNNENGEQEDENLEQDDANIQQADELGKKRSKKSRISWKRFGHWYMKDVETQSPSSWKDDPKQEEGIDHEEPATKDEKPDNNAAEFPNHAPELNSTNEIEYTATNAAITPVESDSEDSEKTVEENSLEQSDLTQVTQLIEIPENTEVQVTGANSSTNPFLEDEPELADEANETSILLDDGDECKPDDATGEANKTLDFVLVDKFSNKPRDESFYLTKKALKVYKKAHLTQQYCQPCCTVM